MTANIQTAESLANYIAVKLYTEHGKPIVVSLNSEQANVVIKALTAYANKQKKREKREQR